MYVCMYVCITYAYFNTSIFSLGNIPSYTSIHKYINSFTYQNTDTHTHTCTDIHNFTSNKSGSDENNGLPDAKVRNRIERFSFVLSGKKKFRLGVAA